MEPLHLPISDTIVAIELPPDHRVAMARYLTGANGKDRRRKKFIGSPPKYARGLVRRRLQALADHPEETAHEMAEQMEEWLRYARDAARESEPSAAEVAEWYLAGRIHGFEGTLPSVTDQQAQDFKQAARAVIGHECGRTPGCAVCLAGRQHRWDALFELTGTSPELVLELHRNFCAAGYPGIPARRVPVDPYEPDI